MEEQQRQRVEKGSVDQPTASKYQEVKADFETIQKHIAAIGDALVLDPPPLEREIVTEVEVAAPAPKEEVVEISKWEDINEKAFYEDVFDLQDVVPLVLLQRDKKKDEKKEEGTKDVDECKDDATKLGSMSEFDLFMLKLPQCHTKQLADEFAKGFFDFNTKANRKQLAMAIYKCPRDASVILTPTYARIVSTMAPYTPEILKAVSTQLQKDIDKCLMEKTEHTFELREHTLRFMCEFVKFGSGPPGPVLECFANLLDDFNASSAEMISVLLQSCGRYLLNTAETSVRSKNFLERMMRLKKMKNLPLRIDVALEDAYFSLQTSQKQAVQKREPLDEFIRKLVFEDSMYEEKDEETVELLRRLPWDTNANIAKWFKSAVLDLDMHADYEHLDSIASLLATFHGYRADVVLSCIDQLFEDIQVGLEKTDWQQAPLRVRQIKLLAELYLYKRVETTELFETLYHLIGFGSATSRGTSTKEHVFQVVERQNVLTSGSLPTLAEENEESSSIRLPAMIVDPASGDEDPFNYFRIKLVCVLLESTGYLFSKGTRKTKMDRFLLFFQRYILTKKELPLRVEYFIADAFDKVRPEDSGYERFVGKDALQQVDAKILGMLEQDMQHLGYDEDKEDIVEEVDTAAPGGDYSGEDVEDDNDEDGSSYDSEDSEDDDSYDSEDDDSDTDSESESESDDTDSEDDNESAVPLTKEQIEEVDFERAFAEMVLEGQKEARRSNVMNTLPMPTHITIKNNVKSIDDSTHTDVQSGKTVVKYLSRQQREGTSGKKVNIQMKSIVVPEQVAHTGRRQELEKK
eukprot:gene751-789_t